MVSLRSIPFPFRLRPCCRARSLVSHPPTSARSPPRSRPTYSKISRVRTSHTTPCTCRRPHPFRVRIFSLPFLAYFSHRVLVSPYLAFAYKYSAPGLVKGSNQASSVPPLLLYLPDYPLPPTDQTNSRSQRAVPRLIAHAIRMFRPSFYCLTF